MAPLDRTPPRAALVSLLLLLACSRAAPGAGEGDAPSTPPGEATVAGPLQATLTTDRETYGPGDPVTFTLRVENVGEGALALEFRSGQRYDFVVEDDGGAEVWRWGAEMGFIQVLGTERLEAGGELTYRERLGAGLPAGRYTARGVLTSSSHPVGDETVLEVR